MNAIAHAFFNYESEDTPAGLKCQPVLDLWKVTSRLLHPLIQQFWMLLSQKHRIYMF